uniref:C2H2-type domain-containing protein n=1 Tax=Takifugu rubripes TaxID=31033 RepID=A0A674MGX7_TAKRU
MRVEIGDDSEPPLGKTAKRGRPRRGEERVKNNTRALSAKVLRRPQRHKDEYGGMNPQDGDRHQLKESDAPAGGGKNQSVQSLKIEVETSKSAVDGSDGADGGAGDAPSCPAKLKGPCCPICVTRRFRDANKLARHMRTCPRCAVTFSQSYHMTRHLRNQHNVGEYVCSKCGKSLNTWLELRAHKKSHAVEGLTCLACDKQFKEKGALSSHLKVHQKVQSSSPKSLTCGDCGKIFGRMYHLKRHIVTHQKEADSESYTCPDCQKRFAFPEDLNKHLQMHVKENNGTCPKCNRTFSGAEELEAHMGVHLKSFPCDTCGKKFKVEYALKKHQQFHQSEHYYCSLCHKRFIKLSHYKRHLTVHGRRETKPYSCTRCDLAFPALVELTEHMSSHEGEQPLNCPICGKTFLNKNKLEKHLSIHTGERPHLCSVCGNGFPSAASLRLHVNIHSGEKPFQCSQCSKSFRSSSGLRLHGRQHMEVRPSYECPECGRTYGRMTELKMHQRYHTGDKPFECACCRKRFISKDKLNVHMRIHTGERPYSCHYCGQTFTQTGDRNRHISKFHLEAVKYIPPPVS